MSKLRIFLFLLAMSGFTGSANATVLSFEDLTTRNNFSALGISNTYQGYSWGYGYGAGVASRTFANSPTGWASATVTNSAVSPAPSGMSGTSYAWNWNGPQSLWIDFHTATNISSVDLANLSSAYGGGNASSIQLFGYDAANNLLSTSSILSLTSTFQTLTANLSGINFLEIRANANSQWFSIDNLTVNQNTVPEPGSIALLGIGIMGAAFTRRRNKSH